MDIKNQKILSQEDILEMLNKFYQAALNEAGKCFQPVEEMGDEYLAKYPDTATAIRKMMDSQVIKCTTSGVLTGFGGIVTLPVAIPANIGSVLYVQMRMITCTAYMAGYDLQSDEVQTLVYACLAGVAVNQIIKKAGVKIGQKVANNLIRKVPTNVLTKINQKVGFRLVTKFGEKGIINMGKIVPGIGAAIGGGLDFVETKTIAKRAYRWFYEGNFETEESAEIIETGDYEILG